MARGIIFDLDGTLIDSSRDIATAINRMRGERGLPPLSLDEVDGMVGEGARVLVRRALPDELGRDGLRQALASYLQHYEAVCLDTTAPFPGVPAMLASLAQGFSLAVLTNKGEVLSRRILDALGIGRFLREVVGGDTLPTRKPNPGGLFLLADRLGIAAGELLMVGDSQIDALTAEAAGCPFALTVWGTAVRDGAAAAVGGSFDAVAAAAGVGTAAGAGGTGAATGTGARDVLDALHALDASEAFDKAAADSGMRPTAVALPAWCFASPADLQAAFGMADDD